MAAKVHPVCEYEEVEPCDRLFFFALWENALAAQNLVLEQRCEVCQEAS